MSERGKLRKLLMRVTAVFMTIIVTCLTYAAAVLVGLCIPGKIIGIVNNSNYYSEQAACIEQRLEDITKDAGLTESVYAGIFETEEIVNITREYTANKLNGYDDELNKEAVRERIKANVLALLEAEGKSKSMIDSDALNTYLEQAASIYEQTVNNALVLNYGNVRNNISKVMIAGIAVMIIVLGACICFIHALTKMRRKTLSYINRALEAAVALTAIPALICYLGDFKKYIVYSPEYMADVVNQCIQGTVMWCLIIAGLWTVLIAVFCVTVWRIKQKKRK